MIFSSASHEEFSCNFLTVSAALSGVFADRLKFSVSERHGQTCSLVCIHDKINICLFDKSCTSLILVH